MFDKVEIKYRKAGLMNGFYLYDPGCRKSIAGPYSTRKEAEWVLQRLRDGRSIRDQHDTT